MDILVDADVLVALAKRDDKNHKKAKTIADQIKNDDLFVSPLTIPEAATVLSHIVSQEAACLFLREARKRNYLELSLTDEIIEKVDAVFLKETKKGISWPDCLNIVLFRKHRLDRVFAFDKIYKRHGISYVEQILNLET